MQLWGFLLEKRALFGCTALKDCSATLYHWILTSSLKVISRIALSPTSMQGGLEYIMVTNPPMEKVWQGSCRNIKSTGKGRWSEIRFTRAGRQVQAKHMLEHFLQETKINISDFHHYCPINYSFYYTYLPANGVQKHGFSLQIEELKSV